MGDAQVMREVEVLRGRTDRPVGEERFVELYRQWYPAVVRLCRRTAGRDADPEALAQETFLRAWAAWETYSDDREFWPWVATIARRLCINDMTGKRRREALLPRAMRSVAPPEHGDIDFERSIVAHTVTEALGRLSRRQQRVLALRDIEGWSYEDIARLEGVTVETVRSSLKRGRAAFRRCYEGLSNVALGGVAGVAAALRRGRELVGRTGEWWRMVGPRRLLGLEDAVPVLLAALMAGGSPAVAPAQSGGAPDPEGVAVSALVPEAPVPLVPPSPVTTTTRLAPPLGAAQAAKPPADATRYGADPAVGHDFHLTPSPSFDEDRTVFASGSTSCADPAHVCSVLLKSSDGGATWERIPTTAPALGKIVLPPDYPRDDRIFSVSLATLSVSSDGGRTFVPIGPVHGPPAATPRGPDGRFSILFGIDVWRMLPLASEYRDDVRAIAPLAVPLPKYAAPVSFAFSPTYESDGRVLVAAVEHPQVTFNVAVYGCDSTRCRRVLDTGMFGLEASVVWSSARPSTAFVLASGRLYRSTDDGRSFREAPVVLDGAVRQLHRLDTAPDGRVFLTAPVRGTFNARVFVSGDDGVTWEPLTAEDPAFLFRDVLALSSGLVLAVSDSRPGIMCSRDGGRTWAGRCGAST